MLHQHTIVPDYFGGVGAWRASGISLFLLVSLVRSQDRGTRNAVVFRESAPMLILTIGGAPDHVLRTVTENSKMLEISSGFEVE